MSNLQKIFLERKIINFIESLEQMDSVQAIEVLNELDQGSIDSIESYLGEGVLDKIKSHLKKHGKAYVGAATIGLAGLGAVAGAKALKDKSEPHWGYDKAGEKVGPDFKGGSIYRTKDAAKKGERPYAGAGAEMEEQTMISFRQYVFERKLMEYVNYLDTLSESELQEELNSLDDETYAMVLEAKKGSGSGFGRALVGAGMLGLGLLGGVKATGVYGSHIKPAYDQYVQPHVDIIKHQMGSDESSNNPAEISGMDLVKTAKQRQKDFANKVLKREAQRRAEMAERMRDR